MKNFCIINFLLICLLSLTSLTANQNTLAPSSNDEYSMADPNLRNPKVFEAMRHLAEACEASINIKDSQAQKVVFGQLKNCLDCLQKSYASNDYEKAKEIAITVHENVGEILECCEDEQVIEDVISCVNEMMDCFER